MPHLDLLTANDTPGEHAASWYAATASPPGGFEPLVGETSADVCIVGGGYTGLSAALHLAEAGFSVVLLEANRVGWGASGRNGGQVGSGQRQDQEWIEKAAGRGRARVFWEMAEEAKALVRARVARHRIDCDLTPGIIYAAHKAAHVPAFHASAEKLRRDYGYDAAEPLDRAAVREAVGSEAYHGGIRDRGAAHLHPLNFALGLARAAALAGARIHERSRVTRLEGGASPKLETARGAVRARFAVLAGNGYLGDLVPEIAARVMPINNFIVATAPLAAAPLIRENMGVADSRFVVNYFRQSRDRRLLFGGGETYSYRFPRDIAALVRPRLAAIYPALADVPIDYAWGGTLAITVNRMPAFQRLGSQVFSAAGYSGHGVAMATLAGKLVAEAVQGTAERFDVLADLPQRSFPGGAFLRAPLLALAMSWYALRDRM